MRRKSWLSSLVRRISAKKAPPPGVTGRVSRDEGATLTDSIQRYMSDLNWLSAKYPFEWLSSIDQLFRYDPNCKKHQHTTIALGNPGHTLTIDAGTEKRAQEAVEICNDLAARCFPFAGGLDGLVNGMFGQSARSGGMCCEWVPDEGETLIERAYLIPVRTIRFRYDRSGSLELGQLQDGRFVALNPVQTTFHAALTEDSNPYPIPPVLAAIQRLANHRQIMGSVEDWFSKLAAMGFLQLKYERPEREPNETTDQYRARCKTHLDSLAKSVVENLTSGIVLGFDDMDATFNNTTVGAAGAKQVGQMVDEDLFAGMGRPPFAYGRNYGHTEALARVFFEELSAEIKNIQIGPKRTVEHGHRLNLALNGFQDVGVSLQFNPTRSLDEFREAESRRMGSDTVFGAYDRGLIDDDKALEELGLSDSAPKAGQFVASFTKITNSYHVLPTRRSQWTGLVGAHRDAPAMHDRHPAVGAHRDAPEINDQRRTVGAHRDAPLTHSARDARRAARKYLAEIQDELSEAGRQGVDAVYEWARDRDIPDEDLFVREVMETFLAGAERTLDSQTLERIAKGHLTTIWTWARYEDDDLFGSDWDRKTRGLGVVLGADDERSLDYLSRVDRLYVSKWVTGDERMSRQIQDFLRTEYLERGLARGKVIDKQFVNRFGDLVERIGEHRARVIIDTGVSRVQNWGEIFALSDEEITEFSIAGPWDRLTCDWCNAMRGRRFRVATERRRIERIIESGDEDISQFHDFITSRFGGSEGVKTLKGLSDAEVQASGMVTAPLHPLCRHRLVAHIVAAGNRLWPQGGFLHAALRDDVLPSLVEVYHKAA